MRSGKSGSFSVDFTLSTAQNVPNLEHLSALLGFAADAQALSGELGIWLCTDEEIADLHLRYMNIEGATDVITFPGEGSYLGDIAVSVETAAMQAVDANHSPQREIAYLCLHGLLHIAGYDDLDEEASIRMISRQDELLTQFEVECPREW